MLLKIIALIACLLVGIFGCHGSLIASPSSYRSALQETTPQSAELTEARELSASAAKLYNAAKYEQALNPAKRALEIREKLLRGDDPLVVDAIGTLAAVQFALKNFKDAQRLYKRVLAADEKAAGVESLKAAATLDVLAWLHYQNGDVDEAERDLKRALAIREKVAGPESKEVMQTLVRLAQLYQFHGERQKSEQFYQRIIVSDTKPESSAILNESRVAYACLLRKLKRPDEAEELEGRVEGTLALKRHSPPVPKGELNGLALKLKRPAYPAEARYGRASGTVVVRVTISEEGKVVHACAESGNRLFWQSSEAAAYGSEFAPTMLDGKPVRVTGIITYNYVAQ